MPLPAKQTLNPSPGAATVPGNGPLWALLVALLVTVGFSGCQSGRFRASHLPPKFRAGATARGTSLKLAHLTSPGANSAILSDGDLLKITVVTGREDEKPAPILARVANDGSVDVPVVGTVPVAGLEAFEASQSIAQAGIDRGVYVRPMVTVEIDTKSVNRVTVLGAVENPGVHELFRSSSDLVSAMAAAGGLTEEAGTEVEIVRQSSQQLASAATTSGIDADDPAKTFQQASYQSEEVFPPPGAANQHFPPPAAAPETFQVDLSEAHVRAGDYRLNDRDVVVIQSRQKHMIHVSGLVQKPGQFDLPLDQDVYLLDAIAMAGGRSSPVADKIFVIRRFSDQRDPLVIQASLSKAKRVGAENLRLAAGDVVSIEQTPTTVVVDTLSKFLRFSVGLAGRTTTF